MLLGTLGANLLGNLLIGEGVKRSKVPGRGVMRTGKIQLKQNQNRTEVLMRSYPLNNIEMQNYYRNKTLLVFI